MPEQNTDRQLEDILSYGESPSSGAFVLDVMHQVQQQQRQRKTILLVFGLIGAVFGALGAFLLSESITRAFSDLPAIGTMQAVLGVVAAAAFYAWFMNDDLSLSQ